jgi:acylphosphatase
VVSLFFLRVVVYGHVQGVNFRAFVQSHARRLGLTGYVRNLSDGESVEVYAEGEESKLEELLRLVQKGPPAARVQNVNVTRGTALGSYKNFQVRYDW